MKHLRTSLMILVAMITGNVMAADCYVSPSGSDSNPGTFHQPFKSIARAQSHVRTSPDLKKQPFTVYLKEGTYYLDDPLVFSEKDSGTPAAPVTYTAVDGEKAVISGGRKLTLSWKPYRNGIFKAKTQVDFNLDQLFVNGERKPMARYPNYDPTIFPFNGYAADAFSPERAANWADPTGGYIHAMQAYHWGGFHYLITGKTADNTVTYKGGWQNNRKVGMNKEQRFVENIFEELDAPEEWFHDRKTKTLYYYPSDGVDIQSVPVEVPRLKHLIEFQGTQKNPVHDIQLTGIIFRHSERTFMETKEPLLRSDWTIYRGGAVTFIGAEDCLIADCEFDQVGGNAIFVNGYNRRITIQGTHIHDAGASGICFVGHPDSVRNPLFEYKQQLSYDEIDKTPGPKSDNYPADCLVDDCLIHGISMVEKQATGVQLSMSKGITVRHCSIYDTGRAGINVSEGTFGGHIIEFCDVFDTVRETGDHGSFNSWGRDRFWHLENAPKEELSKLSLLDTEKTIIRNSRWRCDHGWDVDLDDGSTNYEIYNNVFLNGGLKLREGFHRYAYNNIAVNCGFHPHVWYENSEDVVVNNIWMKRHKPALMKHWGKEIDRNLFTSAQDKRAFMAKGIDLNSIVGDPMFVDPVKGDYRVKKNSPALKLGFKNFPMDQFGVLKPELKSIARVPRFPIPALTGNSTEDAAARIRWMGAVVVELSGEEYSAFGVSKEDGGLHLMKVPPKSHPGKAGLRAGDVIQKVNGRTVKTVEQFLKAVGKGRKKALQIDLVRSQQEQSLTIEP